MKVYLSALGCKLNESELEAWAREFAARGDEIVADAREADAIVVNTCTVTAPAARKSRNLVRHLVRVNPRAQLVLSGCYATLAPEQARTLPNVALVVPNPDKSRLVHLAGQYFRDTSCPNIANGCHLPEVLSSARRGADDASSHEGVGPRRDATSGGGVRTRAFVKIEDGCNMSCAFCIIPLARGRVRSRPQDEIVAEINQLVERGYQEVVLTGVQISDYRLEERDPARAAQHRIPASSDSVRGAVMGRGRLRGLCDLIVAILNRTNLPRLRLTSIAPWDLDPDLLDLFSDARLCRHLHLSLQSGSTTVLRRMRRPYTAEQFARAVELARQKIPAVGITTDVIVGFPGESDAEFQESLEFVKKIEFSRIHVFPYSAREGTPAATMPFQVPERIKEERAQVMQQLAEESMRRFAARFVGQTLSVLYEHQTAVSGFWSGYTDNYIRVVTRSDQELTNRILPTRIMEAVEAGARGELELSSLVPQS